MVLESLIGLSRFQSALSGVAAGTADVTDSCPCDFTEEGRAGQVYNEEAFRHFLAIERKRAERSGRSVLLLLVTLRKDPTRAVRVPPAIAETLFAGLGLCVREVDFIGWYREGQMAAALLAQGDQMPGPEVQRQLAERVARTLSRDLPADAVRQLQIRVLELPRREVASRELPRRSAC